MSHYAKVVNGTVVKVIVAEPEVVAEFAVTTYEVDVSSAVGVPEMTPEPVLSVNPEGRAGEIVYEVAGPPTTVGFIFVIAELNVALKVEGEYVRPSKVYTPLEAPEASEVPVELVAVTVNVYWVPADNPETVIAEAVVPVAVLPPGDAVTV